MKMQTTVLVFTAITCWSFAQVGYTQTPAPFDVPNLTLGGTLPTVNVMARQNDGAVIIGGRFTSVNGVQRNRLARILPSGQVDSQWNPNPTTTILTPSVGSIVIGSDGSVFIGGTFHNIGGQPRRNIAKVSGVTGLADPNWNPSATSPTMNPNDYVSTMVLDGAGSLYIGGFFSTVGGLPRSYIAKVSANGIGATDANWNPSASSTVNTIIRSADGTLFVSGSFTSIGGLNRNGVAKISSSGVVDPIWNPSTDTSGHGITIYNLRFGDPGSIYVIGYFAGMGGLPRQGIARVSTSGIGAADPAFNTSFLTALLDDAVISPSGVLILAGEYVLQSDPNQTIKRLGKFSAVSGATVAGWDPQPNAAVSGVSLHGNDRILVYGGFAQVGGQQRMGLAALPFGTVTPLFSNGFE